MRLIDADKIPWSYRRKLGLGIDFTLDEPDHYYIVVKDEVDAMPTIEAEPIRHGHWELAVGHVGIIVECSECGNLSMETPYCPYCGAKMDERKEV